MIHVTGRYVPKEWVTECARETKGADIKYYSSLAAVYDTSSASEHACTDNDIPCTTCDSSFGFPIPTSFVGNCSFKTPKNCKEAGTCTFDNNTI